MHVHHRIKLIACAAAVAAAVVGFAIPAQAASLSTASTTPVLTKAQVLARMQTIESTYTTVGQQLSDSDAAFLKQYANSGLLTTNDASTVQPLDETSGTTFKKSGSGAGGTGTMSGRFQSVIGTTVDNDAYIKYTATGNSKVSSIRACGHIHAYGPIGSGGVGLTYTKDDCTTVKGTKASYTLDQHYISFTAYVILDADAKYSTSSGSFTTSASFSTVG